MTHAEMIAEAGGAFFEQMFTDGDITVIQADSRHVLPLLAGAAARTVIITDPVWPNMPDGMFPVEDALKLFGQVAEYFPRVARRAAIVLGCRSDPRFLSVMPLEMPFFRVCWLRYHLPSYQGSVLNSGDVAYCFGTTEQPHEKRVMPGEISSDSAWNTHERKGLAHPCPRSLTHMRWLVNNFTQPGDTVIDPFAGSGTTLRAAKDCGRKAIGIEIDAKYIDDIRYRLRQDVLPLGYAVPK